MLNTGWINSTADPKKRFVSINVFHLTLSVSDCVVSQIYFRKTLSQLSAPAN